MKTSEQFLTGLFLLVFPLFLSAQACPDPIVNQDGQQIVVSQGRNVLAKGDKNGLLSSFSPVNAANPSFKFELSDPKRTVPNYNCKDTTCHECGWYKAFWIFGDGNYKKYADDIAHMDTGSRSATYTYARSARFEPSVHLTERYHNDKKPDAARIAVQVNNTTGSPAPADSPVLLNPAGKRAEIDYNHDLRSGYPTVFVLAHLNNDNATRTLLFYNSLYRERAYVPQRIMEYETTEVPVYFDRRVRDLRPYEIAKPEYSDRFNSNFFDVLGRKFANCKEYSYDSLGVNGDLAGGLNEIRLFPVMNTTKFGAGKIPAEPAVLLSVVLGNEPLAGAARDTLRSLINSLLGPDEQFDISEDLLVYSNNQSQEYIRGIAIKMIPVLASHDPNNLFITKIDTLPGGKFRVSFSLRICNEGEMPELRPTLFFRDLSGGRYATQPVFIDLASNVNVTWRQDARGYNANLDGFNISGVPASYQPACRFVYFSMETDQAGVQRLYQDSPRALEVCVQFAGGQGETDCSENDLLLGQEPFPPIPDPVGNNFWLLFFLFFLVLLLIIYARYNFQD